MTDEQRQKVEELLAQNAQSAQSDSDDSGSAAKQDSNQTSSPAKPGKGAYFRKLSTGMSACFC